MLSGLTVIVGSFKMSNLFAAMNSEVTTTTNGMSAYASSLDANVDLFFKIGASRGRFEQLVPIISKAATEDLDICLRILLWSRDIRGGAGERQHILDAIPVLFDLGHLDRPIANRLLPRIVELGRWDDVLAFLGTPAETDALNFIQTALEVGDGLCAKWMPREKSYNLRDRSNAIKIIRHLDISPKEYRKLLVRLTNVVETKMCAKEWGEINYSHVPSLASARYQKAFGRNDTDRYVAYLESLKKGEKGVKINAAAVYPYDILKSLRYGNVGLANEQWKALPDYLEGDTSNTLVVADVSGSMTWVNVAGSKTITPLDVCISLALYLSERNHGIFKDQFITFSSSPSLQMLKGDLRNRFQQLQTADCGMSTNLEAVFNLILNSATKYNLLSEDMPSRIIILSDMQFNQCVQGKNTKAIEMIKGEYKKAGYEPPVVIFWNLNNYNNVPVTFHETGTALVSGFSPAIMKSVLKADLDTITPMGMMKATISSERYNY